MSKPLKQALLTSLTYFIFALVMEMFLFLYFDWGLLPAYFLLDVGILLFISVICFALPRQWIRVVFISFFITLQFVLSFVNISVMKNVQAAFVFDMFYLAGETAAVLETNLIDFWPLFFYIPLFAFLGLSLYVISNIKPKKFETKMFNLRLHSTILAAGILLSFSLYSFEKGAIERSTTVTQSAMSDASLYSNFYLGTLSLKKFGTFGFYFEELFRKVFNLDNKSDITEGEAMLHLKTPEYLPAKQVLSGLCAGSDVIVIMCESLEWYGISEELTPVLYSLANGVDLTELDVKNGEFFYNFTAKSDGTYFAERTSLPYPKLLEQNVGLSLVNYHSKAKTDYSEHSVMLGGYPFKESYTNTVNLFADNSYAFTLPNLLETNGYESAYFHTWHKDFYSRSTLTPRFGFDNTMFIEDMPALAPYTGEFLRLGVKDSAFMQLYYDQFTHADSQKPYLSFFTTVSTHGSYEYNPLLSEYYPAVREYDWLRMPQNSEVDANLYNDYVETYLASVLDLETATAYLVYNLLLEDKLDDTLIVMLSDHNAYYYDQDLHYKSLFYNGYYDEYYGKPYHWAEVAGHEKAYSEQNPNRYAVPAFVYSPRITTQSLEGKSHYVTDFTSAYDLTTTIFNLLGVKYNPSAYLGYPIYCENEQGEPLSNGVIISATSGMFNDKIYSDDGNEILYAAAGTTNEELEAYKKATSAFYDKWRKVNGLYLYNLI